MAVETDWNSKALIAAWKGESVGLFRPSPEFRIRAVSLLPSFLPSTAPSGVDEVELNRWLGAIVVSLLSDNKLSSRQAGYAILELIHSPGNSGDEEEKGQWRVTSPAWTFLLSALKSREKEVLMDSSEVGSVFTEAMKYAETISGRPRSGGRGKGVTPADLLSEVKSLIAPTKTSDGEDRPLPPVFVRLAAAKFLMKCDIQTLLSAITPLAGDLLSKSTGRSRVVDQAERSAKSAVFQAFVRAALTPVGSNSTLYDKTPAANQLFCVIKQGILNSKRAFKVDGGLMSAEEMILDGLSKEYFASLPQAFQDNLLETVLQLGDTVEEKSSTTTTTNTKKPVLTKGTSRKAEIAKRVRRTIRRVLSDGHLLAKHLSLSSEEMKIMSVGLKKKIESSQAGRKSRRGTNVGNAKENETDDQKDASFSTPHWRKYKLLLESFSASKKVDLQDAHVVVPVLFQCLEAILLRKDDPTADYPCQLTLGFLHRCCELCQAVGDKNQLTESDFKVQTVIKCVQEAKSLTVKTHAFLLLGLASNMFPTHLLDNVMSIFTFMGESILRLDDAYSFDVIKMTISAIIPPLLEAHSEDDANNAIVQILRVFVVALPDIPPHRRLPLFKHILEHIRVDSYLWVVLGVFIEGGLSRMSEAGETMPMTGTMAARSPPLPWSMEYAVELSIQYSAVLQIFACKALLSHCRKLPLGQPDSTKEADKSKTPKKGRKSLKGPKRTVEELIFDPELHSVGALRQFQYSILCLVSRILGSDGFSGRFLEMDDSDKDTFRSITRDVVKEVVGYVDDISRSLASLKSSASSGAPSVPQDLQFLTDEQREEWEVQNFVRYGRVLLARATDVLERLKEMLPIDFYFEAIVGIVENGRNEQLILVRKVMELMKNRLQDVRDVDKDSLSVSVCSRLLNFLPEFVNSMLDMWSEQRDENCSNAAQNALLILKLLAQIAGGSHPDLFAQMPEFLAAVLEKLAPMANELSQLLGFGLLCVGAMVAILGVDSILALNQLLAPTLRILGDRKLMNESELLCGSALTAVQKVLELHPRFVAGDRLTSLITAVGCISALPNYVNQPADSLVKVKLRTIKQAIATQIEPRVFCPAMLKAYKQACSDAANQLNPTTSASPQRSPKKRRKSKAVQDAEEDEEVSILGIIGPGVEIKNSIVVEFMSSIVEAHFVALDRKMVGASVREIQSMFLEMFDYRRFVLSQLPKKAAGKEEITAELDQAEDCVIRAFLAPILKLSAEGFRPVFYQLHHWATRAEDLHADSDKSGPMRLITFFRLCERLSDRLKDLFEPFAEHIFIGTVTILKKFIRLTPETEKERSVGSSKKGDEECLKQEVTANDEELLGFLSNLSKSQKKPLLRATIKTLTNCFAFCPPASFMSKERFDHVCRPLVDHLENTEMSDVDIEENVVFAIGKLGTSLATASREAMWQTLSKLIMLKAVHKNAGVRLMAVTCERKLLDALGRDAVATLTTDLLPNVGELMEDEDETVEKEAHALLLQMEDILGERLQKYL